jgi:hypothetical protein
MAVAERIESEPGCLEVPLVNIERWLKRGRLNPVPLIEWRRRLVEAGASKDAMASLLEFSRTENEESEPLKSCSPFPGLLSAAEVPQLRERPARRRPPQNSRPWKAPSSPPLHRQSTNDHQEQSGVRTNFRLHTCQFRQDENRNRTDGW